MMHFLRCATVVASRLSKAAKHEKSEKHGEHASSVSRTSKITLFALTKRDAFVKDMEL